MAPRTSIRITDPATIIPAAPDAADGPAVGAFRARTSVPAGLSLPRQRHHPLALSKSGTAVRNRDGGFLPRV
jgi:hypothetical protein